jgi:excisionase family DNA binding protein
MLTVPEAARLAERDPETIRRWIRSGRLPARKIGTQHMIEEEDLEVVMAPDELSIPESWGMPITGRPLPSIVSIVRRQREEH